MIAFIEKLNSEVLRSIERIESRDTDVLKDVYKRQTLANNISLEVVSKMLGHTNTRMTAHYAKLIDKYIGEQMDKLMDTFTGASDY